MNTWTPTGVTCGELDSDENGILVSSKLVDLF